MKCELRYEDGSINLDMSTKILRVVAKENANIDTVTALDSAYNLIKNQNTRWYVGEANVTVEGTKPSRPTPPTYPTVPQANGFTVMRGADGCVYWDTLSGFYGDTQNATYFRSYPTESWANSLVTPYADYFKVFNESGNLMWSTGTLGDALVRSTIVTVDTFGKIYTVNSTTGRRLHIMLGDSFKSGTYVEDEGGSSFSASGLQFRWSNDGKTVEFGYASYFDNDIINFFNNGGKVNISFFERYND